MMINVQTFCAIGSYAAQTLVFAAKQRFIARRGSWGDAVAGNVFSADRYELARIRSDGNAVLKPEGPRTALGVYFVFVFPHKRKYLYNLC